MSTELPILKAKDAPDMGSFDWADAFRLNEQLTEDERMIQESARAYAQEKLQPRVIDAFANETTDPAIFREMGDMGLLGVTDARRIRRAWAANYVSYGLIAREIERDRQRLSVDDVGAVEPRYVSDLRLRLG